MALVFDLQHHGPGVWHGACDLYTVYMFRTHHSCTPAGLQASQPWHVDGCAGATVGVGCGAMEGSKVISCMDHQEVVTSNTADRAVLGIKKVIQAALPCLYLW